MRKMLLALGMLVFIVGIVTVGVLLQHRENPPSIPMTAKTTHPFFALTSPAFADGASIPAAYTCDDRRELSPTLAITGTPDDAKSLALIMDDPDVPKALYPDGGEFDHWILFNIPAQTKAIMEGESVGTPGANSAGQNAYTGPCPPPQYDPSEHRYVFTLYALDTDLPLSAGASKAQVLSAMQGHIIAQTQLIGRYKRR